MPKNYEKINLNNKKKLNLKSYFKKEKICMKYEWFNKFHPFC